MNTGQAYYALSHREGISVLSFDRLSKAGCFHGFTLRMGGVSEKPFDSLNLGWNRPEPKENIERNYGLLCGAFDIPRETLTLCSYCHGDGVERADAKNVGWGFPNMPRFPNCDGLVTDSPDVTLVSLHADCMPLFLFDPDKKAGAMVHAGWKGVSLRIGQKAVLKLVKEYGCDPSRILAGLGPCICRDCFEIDEPVASVFRGAFPALSVTWENGKFHTDLTEAMRIQLTEAGVKDDNIDACGLCTVEDERFFSFRRDGKLYGATGAMAGFMRTCGNRS